MSKEIDFGQARFIIESYANRVPVNEIASKLGRNRTTVYRVLSEAEEKGAIRRVADAARLIELKENGHTQAELRGKFPKLDVPVVIEIPKQLSEAHGGSLEDDVLQRALGFKAARVVSSITRDGDIVGVGGGVAMAGFHEELQQIGGLRSENTVLTSLDDNTSPVNVSVQGIENGVLLPLSEAYPRVVAVGGISNLAIIQDALLEGNITHLITDIYTAQNLLK